MISNKYPSQDESREVPMRLRMREKRAVIGVTAEKYRKA